MECVWARPAPLTQLYGVVSLALLAALPVSRAWLAKVCMEAKANMPLLPPSTRETWLDSARFILIVFIVMGHYVAIPCSYIAEQSYWLAPLLVWINLFVMPGFAALSGYLSKGQLTQARLGRLLTYVLFPYILSRLVYWVYSSLKFGTIAYFDPFDAFACSLGLEWYLIVLVQWRLLIALLSPFNKQALLICALALGLVSGNWVPSNSTLALQRACAFFPFFALGYSTDLSHIREVVTRSTICKVGLRACFVGTLLLLFHSPGIARLFMLQTLGDLNFDYGGAVPVNVETTKMPPWNIMPVLGPMPREPCGTEWILSFVHRLVRYELGLLLLLGLLAWVPSSSAMAKYGQYTMYPYLLHPWIYELWLMPLINRHLVTFISTLGPITTGGYIWSFTVLLAPALTLALSSAPVRAVASVLIEPVWLAKLLLSQEHQTERSAGKDDPCIPLQIPKASA